MGVGGRGGGRCDKATEISEDDWLWPQLLEAPPQDERAAGVIAGPGVLRHRIRRTTRERGDVGVGQSTKNVVGGRSLAFRGRVPPAFH